MRELATVAIALITVLLTCIIGLGIAQQGVNTIGLKPNDTFYNTQETVTGMVDSAFGWMPMLVLAFIGGVALFFVVRSLGWVNF
jgi:hypothetical protein